jgi:hypothetical protein
MGDLPEALEISAKVPGNAEIRHDPDFEWMLASVHFLSRDFAAAEAPLLGLFQSARATRSQKAAAAYGLCGVYWKTGNFVEQIRFAMWLRALPTDDDGRRFSYPTEIDDQSVYWAVSGWDLDLLLDSVAPDEALESFLDRYPGEKDERLVRYSLAVRRARENRYEEAAEIYNSVMATLRAGRMHQIAALYSEANRTDLAPAQLQQAKYKLAEFIAANQEKIYFNNRLWRGYQRYALTATTDSRMTREEREKAIANERKLKDDQEERWRAYLILRDIVLDEGKTAQGISERFGRQDEIEDATDELTERLRSR